MPVPQSILITQCLQNDFVKPIGRHDPLPNLLHIGHDEARRLMGETPDEGPVTRAMKWACAQSPEKLAIIHIRDWHDPRDPKQAEHLRQFGNHCLRDTEGARFAFPDLPAGAQHPTIIDSLTLNDFIGTNLADALSPFAGKPVKIGLIGVWTEAKISFLAYELRTRYPEFHLAVCSALTASSSRAQHFVALDQLEKILAVPAYPSLGEFIEFLGAEKIELTTPRAGSGVLLEFENKIELPETDRQLLQYLFRDSRSVKLRPLTGGYSGNLILGSQSADMFGHKQAPHVVKIGPLAPIGRERAAFERIESVLGNNAPRITDFADLGERGAIKYRYAAMGSGSSSTFQKLFCDGLPMEKVQAILRAVFVEQLGKFYAAASREKCDLLDYYSFGPKWAPRVREKVEAVLGRPTAGETLRFETGQEFPNPCLFYERDLPSLSADRADMAFFSYVHGDLNGANIIVDRHENVWLIDFFHTHRGHVLKDFIKLENDLLYIFTPVGNEIEFAEALSLSRHLLCVRDLAKPLPPFEPTGKSPQFQRAFETVAFLRSLYPECVRSDPNPLPLLIGQLRYAIHTLSFHESNVWQKQWALYTAGLCAEQIVKHKNQSTL
jgi:nicotinamidase-related amidase